MLAPDVFITPPYYSQAARFRALSVDAIGLAADKIHFAGGQMMMQARGARVT